MHFKLPSLHCTYCFLYHKYGENSLEKNIKHLQAQGHNQMNEDITEIQGKEWSAQNYGKMKVLEARVSCHKSSQMCLVCEACQQ